MVQLLVTGLPYTGRMEIIQENDEVRTCSTSTNFPLDVSYAAGSYMVDSQKIIICVGYDEDNSRSECYQFVNGEWQQMNNGLTTGRMQHASSPTSSHQIWMTGGHDGSQSIVIHQPDTTRW